MNIISGLIIWLKKDYNHPSVVIYSVGNEIQEAGTKQGAWINRILCNKFHELDNTRYTTNALNGLNCAGRRLSVIMRDVAEKIWNGFTWKWKRWRKQCIKQFYESDVGRKRRGFCKASACFRST